YTLPFYAGPEILVASTTAYTAQFALLSILSVYFAKANGEVLGFYLTHELGLVSNAMIEPCDQKEAMDTLAKQFIAT
ncbi:glutamine--fructose-6-phosphate aminotransferase, partial [Bacillus tropicus]|nr:glutamine--fructose-6-phosphate aminotransferase [Bacillus tropicus]